MSVKYKEGKSIEDLIWSVDKYEIIAKENCKGNEEKEFTVPQKDLAQTQKISYLNQDVGKLESKLK